MKELDLRNEEVRELANAVTFEDCWDEELLSGDYKSKHYTCKRIYKYQGKTYVAIYECSGIYNCDELQELCEFYEM